MIGDEATTARLAAMAQQGDRDAYSALLGICQAWLIRYFRRRVAPGQQDDLVQETLLSMHRKLATFDRARPFFPWLAAIARYRWVDHLRHLYKTSEVELDRHLETESEEPGITARISLDRLLTYLPAAQVEAIEMVRIEGLSISEASRASGQSESLIKVNIHRGLKRLTAMIEKA